MFASRLCVVFFMAMGVYLSACGSDSGSNQTPSQELSSESRSQNKDSDQKDLDNKESDKKDTTKKEADTRVSNALIAYDSLYDSRRGDYLGTISFGMYVWMADNASGKVSTVKSVCYDNQDSCAVHGRLYQSANAVDACPSGFHIPTLEDWNALWDFLSQNSQLDGSFNLTLGGYCLDKRDSLVCKNQEESGWYMVAGNGVTSFASVGGKTSVSIAKRDEYYSLRCVNYTYIVAAIEDLPVCDSLSAKFLNSFYVTNEKTSFHCTGKKWVDDFSNDCGTDGSSRVVNDTMYICKYGEWQVAKISDSEDSCTTENAGTSYLFNGIKYVCENKAWRQFTALENAKGLCKDSLIGKIDSIPNSAGQVDYYKAYICDSTGWRTATMVDFIGECDSSRTYEILKYKDVEYVCRSNKWETLNELEQELGVCTPKKQGEIDTTKAGQDYICDSASWRRTGWLDYVGECNANRLGETTSYASTRYMCLDTGWHRLSALEIEIGICSKDNQGVFDTTKSGTKYICDSTGWRIAVITDYGGNCDSSILEKIIEYEGAKYYCSGSAWKEMTSVELTLGFCTSEKKGACEAIDSQYYCCSSAWTKTNAQDARFGMCTSSREGEVEIIPDTAYVCNKNNWNLSRYVSDYAGICDSVRIGATALYLGVHYGCTYEFGFREPTWEKLTDPIEQALGTCQGKNKNMLKEYNGVSYLCYKSGKWQKRDYRLPTCGPENNLERQIIVDSLNYKNELEQFVCDTTYFKNGWKYLTEIDTLAKKYCTPEIAYELYYKDDNTTWACDTSYSYYRWTYVGYTH